MKRAVASLVRRENLYLTVWSKSVQGYTLPGGKVEVRETLFEANARELLEETGLSAKNQTLVYQATHKVNAQAFQVSIMLVVAPGEPREAEPGCPILWMTAENLQRNSPYSGFYREMFPALKRRGIC